MYFFEYLVSIVCVLCSCIVRSHGAHGQQRSPVTGDYIFYDSLKGDPYTVTYDSRSFFIDGKRTLLLGGSIHYPRLSPAQWTDILTKAKNDGLNHAEIYVFWNLHEPSYDFSGNHIYSLGGRANLTGFLETAKNVGIFINLRIGPYVCAEWSFGALPVWLLHVPDIKFRTDNTAWEEEMSTFVKWVASIAEPYLAKNGGPIILAQIENEYHGGSTSYVNWCGELAESLNFDIPWVMCNGESANNTINTCNGDDCYSSYIPTHSSKYPGQPLGWTENEGWFQYWDPSTGEYYVSNETGWANRSPEEMAYVVTTWIAGGGSHHNYYMWYGGNHISWYAGSSITSWYADGVNYHADGLANEPKRSHLNKLHTILTENQKVLLEDKIQYGNEIYFVNGTKDIFAYVYTGNSSGSDTGDTLTFLINTDANKDETVNYNGIDYYLAGKSVSILDNEGMELFNTAKVDTTNVATKRVYKTVYSGSDGSLSFESWNETIPLMNNVQKRTDSYITNDTPLEQIRLSNASSEYMYYESKITTNFGSLNTDSEFSIVFQGQAANAYNVYLNGNYLGTGWNGKHSSGAVNYSIMLNDSSSIAIIGKTDCSKMDCVLTILSSSLGIDNYDGVVSGGDADSQDKKGLTGCVLLYDNSNKAMIDDYRNGGWDHWISTTGENLNVTGSGGTSISWTNPAVTRNSMSWYRTYFTTPELSMFYDFETGENTGVFLLDIGANGMGLQRGHWWLNGIDMGHYNSAIESNGENTMVQEYYFIPLDSLLSFDNNGMNVLVFQEELPLTATGVDITNVNLVYSTFVIPE